MRVSTVSAVMFAFVMLFAMSSATATFPNSKCSFSSTTCSGGTPSLPGGNTDACTGTQDENHMCGDDCNTCNGAGTGKYCFLGSGECGGAVRQKCGRIMTMPCMPDSFGFGCSCQDLGMGGQDKGDCWITICTS